MYLPALPQPSAFFRSIARPLAAVSLIALMACGASATAKKALLYAHGKVTVNGAPVSSSTVVMPGDKIQTAADSAASIVSRGSIVTLPASKTIVFGATAPVARNAFFLDLSRIERAPMVSWLRPRRHKCISPDGDDRECKCDFELRPCRAF